MIKQTFGGDLVEIDESGDSSSNGVIFTYVDGGSPTPSTPQFTFDGSSLYFSEQSFDGSGPWSTYFQYLGVVNGGGSIPAALIVLSPITGSTASAFFVYYNGTSSGVTILGVISNFGASLSGGNYIMQVFTVGIPTFENVLLQNNDAGGNNIVNLADPTDPQDCATKAYIDAKFVALLADSNTLPTLLTSAGIMFVPDGTVSPVTSITTQLGIPTSIS